jgi:membrane-associated phospholipid phosphatase
VLAVRLRRLLPLWVTGATVIIATALGTVIKNLTDRPRPPLADRDFQPLIELPQSSAMPSGHALTAFAAATVLSTIAPRLRWPLVALAGTIALSRVYLGVHYPSDVLVGSALGVGVGLGVLDLLALLSVQVRPDNDRHGGEEGDEDAVRQAQPAGRLADHSEQHDQNREAARADRDLPRRGG